MRAPTLARMQSTPILQQPAFRSFWLADVFSAFGAQITLLGLPLIAAQALNATPIDMGWLLTLGSLPYLLFGLPVGALVDRSNQRRLLILADATRTLGLLALMLGLALGMISMPLLLLGEFVIASATVVYDVAAQTYLPRIAAKTQLLQGNSYLETSRSTALILGAAITGALVGWLSPLQVLAVNAAIFAISTVFLSATPQTSAGTAVAPSGHVLAQLAADIGEGLRFVATHALVRPLVLTALLWNLAWFCMNSVFVLYTTRDAALSPALLGLITAFIGIGTLLGALAAPLLRKRLTLGQCLLVGPMLSTLAAALTALPLAPALLPVSLAIGQFLFGFGPAVWTVTQLSVRQGATPPALLGRVAASVRFASLGMRPLGALVGGAVGSAFGLPATLLLAVFGFAACALPVAASALGRLQDVPETTLAAN